MHNETQSSRPNSNRRLGRSGPKISIPVSTNKTTQSYGNSVIEYLHGPAAVQGRKLLQQTIFYIFWTPIQVIHDNKVHKIGCAESSIRSDLLLKKQIRTKGKGMK